MKSLEILSSVLIFMVDHVKKETGEMIDQEPIHFKHVFTLPTCSCAGARTFMTQAAEKVGLFSIITLFNALLYGHVLYINDQLGFKCFPY